MLKVRPNVNWLLLNSLNKQCLVVRAGGFMLVRTLKNRIPFGHWSGGVFFFMSTWLSKRAAIGVVHNQIFRIQSFAHRDVIATSKGLQILSP